MRSLRAWLVGDDTLRGRVQLAAAAPEPGTLGGELETLAIALGPGGAATALAGALITWIRRQAGSIRVKVAGPDGAFVEVTASRARGLDAAQVQGLVTEVLDFLTEGTTDSGSTGGSGVERS